ncbi:hypothetical protein SIO70_06790 [Chitinophaga sancti]|uniref:hypothetical protein n=1 Tax=Chitinophaga sancti TaxID=1004 RepID=UPI002A74C198|nr:hypothetical protein [Chitinophaga sancti]WPQ64573.1 hypothetical protein SIO70_06790 [Chitinophaga sancti]
MIQISKKATIAEPNALQTIGATATAQLEADYNAGVREFSFDATIYAHEEVKNALIDAQNYKCCFCEAKIGHIDDGDVEHFRPKKRSQQAAGTPYIYPGYYWTAYQWNNLFLACTKCNQRNKKSLFPLLNPGHRALFHGDNIALEQPVFIHPADENPEDFISFNHENIYAVGNNQRGTMTIALLELDRSELTQARAEMLDAIEVLYLTVSDLAAILPRDVLRDSIDLLNAMRDRKTDEDHQYAGMFRAFFSTYPIP